MNSVILILTPEEAGHLSEMMWLLKGCRMKEEITESMNTLEKKINSMAVEAITKIPKQKAELNDPQWPIDY
jgi:hypothetical protein